MSIYRMNGKTKVAEITSQNVDWTTQIEAMINEALDKHLPKVVADTTDQLPNLTGGVYYFFMWGVMPSNQSGEGIITLSSLGPGVTKYFNRIEGAVAKAKDVEFLATNNADYSLMRGVTVDLVGTLSCRVWGTIHIVSNSCLISWVSTGSGSDWEEVGKSEFIVSNNTLPAGTLNTHRGSASGPINRCVVVKLAN